MVGNKYYGRLIFFFSIHSPLADSAACSFWTLYEEITHLNCWNQRRPQFSDVYIWQCSLYYSLMISPSAGGKNAVRVESFGKSVDTHLFTNTKLPCWNALHQKWQTVWGCLFFSLPVTPSPYRQLHTHCMSISEEGLFHRDMALLYYLKVKSIELWFAVICLHVTHPHTGTSLKSHPHCSSSGIRQIIFIQNRTWWECLRSKVEKIMDLEWVWA